MPGGSDDRALAQVGAVAILSKEENKGRMRILAALTSASLKEKLFREIK